MLKFGQLVDSMMTSSRDAARFASNHSGFVGTPLRKATRWGINHPKTLMAGAFAAGAYSTHPIRSTGIGDIAEEGMFGDPNAIGTIVKGSVQSELRQMFYRPSEQRVIDYLSTAYRAGPPMGGIQGPYSGPSGNIVLGLYNLRAK